MTHENDWSAAARDLAAEPLDLEAFPDDATLAAYERGELSPAEAAAVREALGIERDEPLAVEPGHPAALTPQQKREDWQRLAARLGIESPAAVRAPLGPSRLHPEATPRERRERDHRTRWLKPILAWAAGLAVATLGLVTYRATSEVARLRAESNEPQVVHPRSLVPEEGRRGPDLSGPSLPLAPGQRHLTLNLPEAPSATRYRLELSVDQREAAPFWVQENLEVGDAWTITLELPRNLTAGRYEATVEATWPSEVESRIYTFRFAVP